MRGVILLVFLLAAVFLLGTSAQAQVVVHEIPAPSTTVTGLCWDGSALWVSDQTASIYKVNPSTGAVMRTLTGPVAGSRGLAYANGNLWTISRVASDLHIYKIDTTTGAVVAQIVDPTNGYSGGIAWDGSALWVSAYFPSPMLFQVNPVSGDTLATRSISAVRPYGVAYDGSTLWLSSEDTGAERVYRVNSTTGATLWSFTLPPHTPQPGRRPRGVTWDGQYLWVLAYEATSFNVKIFQYDVSNANNPDINFVENSHDFAGHVVGHPVNWSVIATNIGNSNVVISGASFASGIAFQLVEPAGFPVTVGTFATTTFTVRFNPLTSGVFRDTLRVASNDPDENPYRVALLGTGLPDVGHVDPQPAQIDFGNVRISSPLHSTSRTLQLYNQGTGTLHVTGLTIVGDSAFAMDSVHLPAAIDSFAFINVRLWFAPRLPQGYAAALRIRSDDPAEPILDVPLTGWGDATPVEQGTVLWYFESTGTSSHDINSVQWIGDVNGDGTADVLAASGNYLVYCLNGSSTGIADTFWTFNCRIDANHSGIVYNERGMCSIPDITGDGVEDVIIGTSGSSRSVYALSGATGEMLWTFDTHFWGTGGLVYEVAPAGDLNGDHVTDVLAATADDASRVFALSGATGQLLWPGTPVATFYCVRAIRDVTGDNIPDVVGGGTDGMVRGYNGATGAALWNGSVGGGSPVFEFLPMGNANPEINQSEDLVVASAYSGVYCIDGGTGAQIWATGEPSSYVYSVVVGSDLTGDGVREVYSGTVSGWVWCFDGHTGQVIWSQIADPFGDEFVLSMAALPDITGDGIQELACGTLGDNAVLMDGWDGTRVWATTGTGPNSPVDAISGMPDIDNSGSWEVLVGRRSGVVEVISGSRGRDLAETRPVIVGQFALGNAYPNPFNSSTTISYTLPRASETQLDVFDLLGRHVITLISGLQSAGMHSVTWSGMSEYGELVGTGVYFVRMKSAGFVQTRKLLLLK